MTGAPWALFALAVGRRCLSTGNLVRSPGPAVASLAEFNRASGPSSYAAGRRLRRSWRPRPATHPWWAAALQPAGAGRGGTDSACGSAHSWPASGNRRPEKCLVEAIGRPDRTGSKGRCVVAGIGMETILSEQPNDAAWQAPGRPPPTAQPTGRLDLAGRPAALTAPNTCLWESLPR